MQFETLITNGDVVTENGIRPLDVALKDGRIAALVVRGTPVEAVERIDAAGKWVLPGAIDIHFHCRAPAYPERGDFATETRAAAAGGVTTIFEMPISKPCCATPKIFRERRALGEANAYVNFALYAAPGLLQRDEIHAMADEGAIGFKIFTTAPPSGRGDEFEGLCLPDAEGVLQALQFVAETGLVCSVHSENNRLLEYYTARLQEAGRHDPAAHLESRPPVVESLAVAELLAMNEIIGADLHIAHLSARLTLDVLRRFKRTGAKVTAETCPHFLVFTEADMERAGAFGKINPPLRTAEDQAALWEGLCDGSLISVTTDHSPFTQAEKEKGSADIWKAPPGAPGVEQLLLVMMDAALKGRVSVEKAVQLISTNGAKRFGIYPHKGAIAVDADADLVIFDPAATTTVEPEKLFTKAKDCERLYAGMTFQGRILRTLVGGKTVFVDGAIVGEPGWGRFVRPDRARVDRSL